MPVTITLNCGGCDARAEGTAPLRRNFVSFSGQDHGFGQFRTGTVEDITPEGWMPYDPYTQCTYCPKCWASIEAHADTPGDELDRLARQGGK
jgi:hypothetical protein